jgi:hypothetical protein
MSAKARALDELPTTVKASIQATSKLDGVVVTMGLALVAVVIGVAYALRPKRRYY